MDDAVVLKQELISVQKTMDAALRDKEQLFNSLFYEKQQLLDELEAFKQEKDKEDDSCWKKEKLLLEEQLEAFKQEEKKSSAKLLEEREDDSCWKKEKLLLEEQLEAFKQEKKKSSSAELEEDREDDSCWKKEKLLLEEQLQTREAELVAVRNQLAGKDSKVNDLANQLATMAAESVAQCESRDAEMTALRCKFESLAAEKDTLEEAWRRDRGEVAAKLAAESAKWAAALEEAERLAAELELAEGRGRELSAARGRLEGRLAEAADLTARQAAEGEELRRKIGELESEAFR